MLTDSSPPNTTDMSFGLSAGLSEKLLARLPAVVFELAPDGATRRVSHTLSRLTGYSAPDTVGRNFWELLCRGAQATQVAPLLSRLHAGDVSGYPIGITTQSGETLTWEIDTANQYTPTGELLAVVGCAVSRGPAPSADRPASAPGGVAGQQPAPAARRPSAPEALPPLTEQLFRLALKNAPVSLAAQDHNLRFIWAYNQRSVPAASVVGKTDADIFPSETAARLIALKRQVLETGRELREQLWLTSGGRRLFIDLFLEPLRDALSQIVGVGMATVDLTQQRLTEDALRESERRYHTLFETMREGFALHEILTDEQGGHIDYRFQEVNPAFETLVGLRATDMLGRTISQILPGLEHTISAVFQQTDITCRPQYFDWCLEATQRTCEVSVYCPQPGQIVTVFSDATVRHQARADQERHLARLGQLVRLSQQMIAARSFDDLLQAVADGARQLTGSRIGIVGHGRRDGHFRHSATSYDQSAPASPEAERLIARLDIAELAEILPGGALRLSATELQRLLTDGASPVDPSPWHNAVGAILTGVDGIVRGVVFGADNIQAEYTSEDQALLTQLAHIASLALQQMESRLQAEQRAAELNTVFNALTDAVMVYNDQDQLVQANPVACAAFGLDPAAPGPFSLSADITLLHTDRRPVPVYHWPWRCAMRGETVRNERYIITRPGHADINILASATPLPATSIAHGVVATWHDVTERDQLLSQLENERSRWQATVESMLDYVIIADSQGQEVYLNASYAHSVQLSSRAQTAYPGLFQPDSAARPLGLLPLAQALRRNASIENVEMLEITPAGEERAILWNASPIRRADGEVAGAVAVGHDITPQKAAEAAWRAARDELEQRVHERTQAVLRGNEELRAEIAERLQIEQQLRLQTTALQAAANGIVITDRQGVILWVNPAFTRLTGFSSEECLGQTPRLLRSGEHPAAYFSEMWQTILAGRVWHGETINCHKSGRLYTEEQTITPVIDPDGQVSYFVSIKQDITERKRTEQALLRANALLERVFDSIDLLIAYLDRNFNFLRVNRAYAAMEGHPPDYFVGQNHFALYPGPETRAIFEQVVDTGEAYAAFDQPFIYASRLAEAPDSYWDWSLQPVKDAEQQVVGLVFSLVNVTFRKLAQDQLRHYARHSQMLAEVSRVLAEARLDIQSVVDTIAHQMGQLFGDLCLIRLLSEDSERLKLVAYHYPDPEMQARIMQDVAPLETRVGAGIAGGVAASGQAMLIPSVGPEQIEALLGIGQRTLVGLARLSLLSVPLRAPGRTLGVMSLVRLNQSPPYTSDDLSTAQNLADRAALAIANAHLYQDLEQALAHEQAMRTQLVQVEKLAAMGRMVASVAHELNNPLQTIKNCLYLSHKDLPFGSPIHQYLDMATSETNRLANLVAQLREVYRPGAWGKMQPLDLLPLLAEVPVLLTSQLEVHHIEWRLSASLAAAPVYGVADQLKQVFTNLTQNALEAMTPGGGILAVSVSASESDRQIAVTFRDTGPGIPAENLNRLFEPFFTTKFTGLGLGLSICNDIVLRHGGRLSVESQPGHGAEFTVQLPRRE